MSSTLLSEAEARMGVEFIKAGHTSLADPIPDGLHPLHMLFLATQSRLQQYCRWFKDDKASRTLKHYRVGILGMLLKLKDIWDKAKSEGIEVSFEDCLPSNAELLALRFATQEESDNVEIVQLLTELRILHLWHIPPHTDTEAQFLETMDDVEDVSTEGAPTEDDFNLESTLSGGLADVDRKLKAIQDAKKNLEDKLAAVREAETAVLQAQGAMLQAQNAMAMADVALLQSPMRF